MMTEGDMRLSELQERLLALLARDMTPREMAETTGYSKVWVYQELQAARETLGVRTNAGAVVEALRWGLVQMTE
jgi:DNA-binding CsgD family transcriptional regulator